MPLTKFPNGVSSFGVPVFGSGNLITQGNFYFVKPSSGDDGNDGKSPTTAVKTVSHALSLCTAGQNDTVFLFAESNTAASTTDYQSSALAWNKDLTHLIGVCAPSAVSQRARIANTASSNLATVMTISANGCRFENIQILNGDDNASALMACTITGDRNYFLNVHFAGCAGGTTQANTANAGDVKIDGGDENVFERCTFGVDTISRGANCVGNILFDGAATRTQFVDCLFQEYLLAAGCPHVTIADTTAIDRWQIFKNCLFVSESTNKTIDMTEVFDIPAGIAQGKIALFNCATLDDGGAPVWTAGTEGIIWANMIAPTASAAGGFMTNL